MAEVFDPAGGPWSAGTLPFGSGLAVKTLIDLDST